MVNPNVKKILESNTLKNIPIPRHKVLAVLAQHIYLYLFKSKEIMKFLERIGRKVGVTYRKVDNLRVANCGEEKQTSRNEFHDIQVPSGI